MKKENCKKIKEIGDVERGYTTKKEKRVNMIKDLSYAGLSQYNRNVPHQCRILDYEQKLINPDLIIIHRKICGKVWRDISCGQKRNT